MDNIESSFPSGSLSVSTPPTKFLLPFLPVLQAAESQPSVLQVVLIYALTKGAQNAIRKHID